MPLGWLLLVLSWAGTTLADAGSSQASASSTSSAEAVQRSVGASHRPSTLIILTTVYPSFSKIRESSGAEEPATAAYSSTPDLAVARASPSNDVGATERPSSSVAANTTHSPSVKETTKASSSSGPLPLPIIIGISTGGAVLLLALLVVCWVMRRAGMKERDRLEGFYDKPDRWYGVEEDEYERCTPRSRRDME